MPILVFILYLHAELMGQNFIKNESVRSDHGAVVEIPISDGEEPIYNHPGAGKLRYGPFAVGFSVLGSWDSSRTMPDGHLRAVQIGVWYPADEAKKEMKYRDYIALSANESDLHAATDSEKSAAVRSFKEFGISVGTSEKSMDQWLSTKMYAGQNAGRSKGDFPVVIVAQGNFQGAADQAFICEYLASHGYIVATSPSPTRIVGPVKSKSDIFPMALDQARDMELILSKVKSEFHADGRDIAVLAHSFGARSALVFVNRHTEVRAFISLDGGIGNGIGKEWIKDFTEFDPLSIRTPILHFYQNVDTVIVMPDFELLRCLKKASCRLVLVKNMHHFYFSSVGFAAGDHPDLSKSSDPDLSLKCQGYAYYTLDFLNDNMGNKNDKIRNDLDSVGYKVNMVIQELK